MLAERLTVPIRPEMRSRYPADWKLRSRFVREVRAKNRCEGCGVPNGAFRNNRTGEVCLNVLQAEAWAGLDGDPVAKIVLTCAHVHDHRPEAASLLNIAALCQRCHNRHDAKERASGRRERAFGCESLFGDDGLTNGRKNSRRC